MKVRTFIINILAVLVFSNVSPAQVAEATEQGPQEPVFQRTDSVVMSQPESLFIAQAATAPTPSATRPKQYNPAPVVRTPRVSSTLPSTSPTNIKIFELKYAKAESLAVLIENLFRTQVQVDNRLNRLIVNATQEQMEGIQNLIEAMDVEAPEESTSRDVQNYVYRIYMFEVSSGNENMKSFSMILRTTSHVSSQELLDTAENTDLRINEFLQSNDFNEPQVEILIQGKAASNESLKRMISGLAPESHIIELKWDDDETFTNSIATAQYTQLPDQMQKHIRKFLGDDIRTVGYWFGNSSVPGDIEAPIGPWRLNLRLNAESDGMLEINVEVEVPGEIHRFERRLGRERSDEILSNTVRAKTGKPIIIGYNRESYGARKMGAMVIVPEAEMIQIEENKSSY